MITGMHPDFMQLFCGQIMWIPKLERLGVFIWISFSSQMLTDIVKWSSEATPKGKKAMTGQSLGSCW